MSAFSFRAAGTVAAGNGALNPGAPAGKTNGDLLLLALVGRDNAQTAPAPANWQLVSSASPVSWNYLYARYADGSADDTPTGLQYGGTTRSQAQIAAFSGGGAVPLANIALNSNSRYLPGTQTDVDYDALTVAEAAALIIAITTKNKTTTSNGTSFNAFTGMTQIGQNVINGTDISFYWGYQIQTTATDIAAGSQTLTGTTETLQFTSQLTALRSVLLGATPRRRMGRTPIGLTGVRIY